MPRSRQARRRYQPLSGAALSIISKDRWGSVTLMGFDDSNIRWNTLEGIPDVWYQILEVDAKNRIVDVLFKFSANARIVLHRHGADYRTFVIQGELRLYDADDQLTEIRKVGSYVAKTGGGPPHREGGGDQDVIALFSNRNVDGPIYEILDDDLNVVATLGLPEFGELLRLQQLPADAAA